MRRAVLLGVVRLEDVAAGGGAAGDVAAGETTASSSKNKKSERKWRATKKDLGASWDIQLGWGFTAKRGGLCQRECLPGEGNPGGWLAAAI